MQKCSIIKDQRFNRCMVTVETVDKGELVVEETPFASGPKQNSGIICLGCYRFLEFGEDGDSLDRCAECDWPLCSACVDSTEHQGECNIFSNARVTFAGNVGEDGVCTQLDCITPLRVLLAKENDPERWEREIAQMEFHDEERRQLTEIWNADRVNIAQYLRGPCKLADRFTEDLIMQVVGILEVNAFEARTLQGYAFRCVYPQTAILAHNCVPNVTRCIYPSEGYKIRLRAMRNLEAGQQLFISYTHSLNGTAERQESLKTGKFFICECERCKDATELGTNFSTVKCGKCENGWILTTNPLDSTAEWNCNCCEFKMSHENIKKALSVIQTELTQLKAMDISSERLEKTEEIMRKYRTILHPLHYMLTGLRQNLIEMYGRVNGYEMIELPDILLERKADLCRQLLRVLDIFEPGLSRSRAMIMYELHVPLVLLAKSAFIAGCLTKQALKMKLMEPIFLLQNCVEILQYEDKNSQEGVIGQVAQQALEQLSTSAEGLSE